MFAPLTTAKERYAICKTCDKNVAMTCVECVCFIPAKVTIAATACPLDKWLKVEFVKIPIDAKDLDAE
jgi:hypothetical protein